MNILRSNLAIHTTKFGNKFEMELWEHIFFTHTAGSCFKKTSQVKLLKMCRNQKVPTSTISIHRRQCSNSSFCSPRPPPIQWKASHSLPASFQGIKHLLCALFSFRNENLLIENLFIKHLISDSQWIPFLFALKHDQVSHLKKNNPSS